MVYEAKNTSIDYKVMNTFVQTVDAATTDPERVEIKLSMKVPQD